MAIQIPDKEFFSIKEVVAMFSEWFGICVKTFYNNHRKKMPFVWVFSSKDKRISRKDLILYIKSLKNS